MVPPLRHGKEKRRTLKIMSSGGAAKSPTKNMNMKVRRVNDTRRTIVFHFSSWRVSGFPESYYTLLRTSADVAIRPWRAPLSRAAGPGSTCTREYGKDQLPYGFPQDGEIIQHSPFRRQIARVLCQSERNFRFCLVGQR